MPLYPSPSWKAKVGQGDYNLDWHKNSNLLMEDHMSCITCKEFLPISVAKKISAISFPKVELVLFPSTTSFFMDHLQTVLQAVFIQLQHEISVNRRNSVVCQIMRNLVSKQFCSVKTTYPIQMSLVEITGIDYCLFHFIYQV